MRTDHEGGAAASGTAEATDGEAMSASAPVPAETSPEPASVGGATFSPAYARYALGLLFLVMVFNLADRQILAMLVPPIKEELQVSDTAMGVLTGFAFALFYATLGIPVARWADRGVRRSIIALGLLVWSAMTAACGLARSFAELALARVGVGVGEAAGAPPSHSLVADYFPPERRATALGLLSMGGTVGMMAGYLAAGFLSEHYGWRTTFLLLGLPGVVLALLVRLTLREPARGRIEGLAAAEPEPTWNVLRFMLALRSYRHLTLAAALHAFAGYGAAGWTPTFLFRVHEMSPTAVGLVLAGLGAGASSLGLVVGGALSDRLGRRDARFYMWLPAAASLAALPFSCLFLLVPTTWLALVFLVPQSLFGAMYAGPTHAMTQSLARPRMRAQASAMTLFALNLVGLGLGPLAVGALNDALAPRFGAAAVRYSLLVIAIPHVLAVVHNLWAARTLRDDLEAKHGGPPARPPRP